MEQHAKISIIACYFGTLPNYFPLWLNSCTTNSQYTFLFFTDSNLDSFSIPSNVICFRYTFEDIRKYIAQRLRIDPAIIKSPYKLTDFKVAYGDIFQDYLKDADYWGYCDIDLIFGCLDHYIPSLTVCQYDKIYELGHLTLYKNTESMRKLYTLSGGAFLYKEVYSSPLCYSFDEHCGMIAISKQHNVNAYSREDMADISCRLKRMTASRQRNYENQVFYSENGKVYRAYIEDKTVHQQEFVYIHYQKRTFHSICSNFEAFYILSDQVISKDTPGTPDYDTIVALSEFVSTSTDKSELKQHRKCKISQFIKSSAKEKWIWIKQKIFEMRTKPSLNKGAK